MKATDQPIVVTHNFNASIKNVWEAITELDQMKQWFFKDIPNFKAEVGFKTKFDVHSSELTFTHVWQLVEIIPQQKIVYSWKYKQFLGAALVTFELTTKNSQTLLTLTNNVLEDFPQNILEFKTESCIAGWEYFIKNRLKNYLEPSK